ncbi:CHAT domain-containing protein [Streptomyces sp. NPDC047000]|uniref:CHAT domain-containing protein n=1 Tax=Streptomyces sp. NPDC047000 TaxID=3155474 RepID=UPI0033FA9E10
MDDNSSSSDGSWARVMAAEARVDDVAAELLLMGGFCLEGCVDAEFVARMKELAADIDTATREFEALVADELDGDTSKVAEGLRETVRTTCAQRRADACEWVARAYDALGDATEAVRRFATAMELHQRLGNETSAQRCAVASAHTQLYSSGNVDAEIRRLAPGAESVGPATDLEAIGKQIETGQLYARGGDLAEARRLFEAAAEALEAAAPRNTPLPEALERLMDASGNGTAWTPKGVKEFVEPVQRAVTMHGLRQTLGLARAQIAEDPREARRYTEEFRAQPDFAAVTTAFLGKSASDAMQAASGPIGDFAAALAEIDAEQSARPTDEMLARLSELWEHACRLGVTRFQAGVARRRGELLLRTDRPLDAIAVLREALGLLGDASRHDFQPVLLARLAACHAAIGDWREVSRVTSRGIALVEAHRYDVSGTYMKDFYLKDRIDLYRLAVEAAYYAKDAERLFHVMELSKARRLANATTRPSPEQMGQISELSRRIDESPAGSRERAELSLRRRLLWDHLLAGGDTHGAPVPALSDIQRALLPEEAVLYHYWLDDSRLLVVLVRRERKVIGLRTLPPKAREALDRLVELVRPENADGAIVDIDGPLAESAPWLLPSDRKALTGCTRLYVSPHGLLHSLPIHALPWGNGTLLDDVSVVYLPNLAGLLEDVPEPGPGTVVAGVSEFVMPGLKRRDELAPGAREIAAMHRSAGRPVTEFTDAQATKGALLDAAGGVLQSAGCVSLLTHGASVDADTPMESILWLHDLPLDGLEMAMWPLSGALVTLTACCSGQRAITMAGGEAGLPGDEVFGLQAACFAAGASAVLGALWPIKSKQCVQISAFVHEALVNDRQAPDQALRTAVLRFRRTAGLLGRATAVWAPLFLVSRGRPRPLVSGSSHV